MPDFMAETGGKTGWIEAVRRIFRFQRGVPASSARTSGKRARAAKRGGAAKRGASPVQRQLPQVRKLAGEGLPTTEIARRTGLAQDVVSMLLHMRPLDSVESSGQGTFFRILQARIAS